MTLSHEPAQLTLVKRFLDWELLQGRLNRYPAIARAFPIRTLISAEEKGPYYCHPIAWRLGTWTDGNDFFPRLNHLLAIAERLPNWEGETPLLRSNDYGDFWSLVWQLQVAEYLCSIGTKTSWSLGGGPDLFVEIDGQAIWVECYCYRKSFGNYSFVQDLTAHIDEGIRAHYEVCKPLRLGSSVRIEDYLDRVLTPLLDSHRIAGAKKRASEEYPVLLHCEENFWLYMEGEGEYMPGIVHHGAGPHEEYLKVAVGEVIRAKGGANFLAEHRPNVVLANMVLSSDFQHARYVGDQSRIDMSEKLPESIDCVAISALGIDETLSRNSVSVVASRGTIPYALDRIVDFQN